MQLVSGKVRPHPVDKRETLDLLERNISKLRNKRVIWNKVEQLDAEATKLFPPTRFDVIG
jgi:hypothetical protein